jgi:hypothetical protein
MKSSVLAQFIFEERGLGIPHLTLSDKASSDKGGPSLTTAKGASHATPLLQSDELQSLARPAQADVLKRLSISWLEVFGWKKKNLRLKSEIYDICAELPEAPERVPLSGDSQEVSALKHTVHLSNEAFLLFRVVLVDTIDIHPKVFQSKAFGNQERVFHKLGCLF